MSKALRPLLRHGARRGLPTKAGFSRGPAPGESGDAGVSRRDVLRLGAQGVAAALLAPALVNLAGCAANDGNGPTGARPWRGRGRAPTVIVVGAGFGGLACADTLAHAGANVIVLEATGRAGGRVRTDRAFIPGDNVELGGEFIGRNHPTWLAYAQEFNLRLEEPKAAPEPAPTTERSTEEEKPPTLPPAPGEVPHEPTENAPQPAPEPSPSPVPPDASRDAAPQPSAPPAFVAPRPKPFETEMDAPAGQGRGGARGPAVSRVQLAMVAQPDNAGAAAPAPPPAPVPAPGSEPYAPSATTQASNTQPATTQPATTAHAGAPEEPIILGGKLVRGEAADKLYKEVDEILAKVIELARGVDPIRPWTSPNAADLDGRSFASFVDDQKGLSDEARALMLSTAETDNGVVAERMSLLGYLAMVAGGGFQAYYDDSEAFRLADGNDALATALAQKLGNRVRLNSPVDLVRRESDGVIVRTRTGQTYRGDAVVVAVPPSVWERIQLLPPVRESMQPQMGENVKLIVALREAVWEKQGLTPDLVSDGLVGMSWAATDPLARGPVALTLFSGGHQAEQLRRLDPDERNSQAFRAVAPAYPDVPAAFLRARFVDWPGMPLTRASYSFPAPGQVTAYGSVLVDGIMGDGRAPLMFAGEHTSYAFVGYMEGALSSGVRVARTLLGQETTPVSRGPAETEPATTEPATTEPSTAPTTTPSDVAPDPLEGVPT